MTYVFSRSIENLVIQERIDHPRGAHDDMVIAWLLGNWFANYGSNLSFYGIRPGIAASMVAEKGSVLSDEDQEHSRIQKQLRERVTILKVQYSDEENYVRKSSIERELTILASRLDSDGGAKVLDDIRNMDKEKQDKKSSLSDAFAKHRSNLGNNLPGFLRGMISR